MIATPMRYKLGKDEEAPTGRINLFAPASLVEQVEEWRSQLDPKPNKSEAARMLIEMGLAAARARAAGREAGAGRDQS